MTTSSSVGSKYFGAVEAINSAVFGVISDILIITRLPAANAADAGTSTEGQYFSVHRALGSWLQSTSSHAPYLELSAHSGL